MDPNENLREQVRIADLITSTDDIDEAKAYVFVLAELVQALNTWICNGGFLPTAWKVS